jgi:hypothetical protein
MLSGNPEGPDGWITGSRTRVNRSITSYADNNEAKMTPDKVKEKTRHFKNMTYEQLLRIIANMPPDNKYDGMERFEAEIELHKRNKKPKKIEIYIAIVTSLALGAAGFQLYLQARQLTGSASSGYTRTNDYQKESRPPQSQYSSVKTSSPPSQ